jgi:poly(3-hydroxybutyrate) depolymerase
MRQKIIAQRTRGAVMAQWITVVGTVLAPVPSFAGWGATQETIAENRTWLYTPDSPIAGNDKILNGKRALVIMMHGCSQSATQLKEFGNWGPTAEEYGLVVAIPDVDQGVIAGCWNYDEALDASGHAQDILRLVENLKSRPQLEIDSQQVYLTGLSSGAALALQLACKAPRVFAGVGAVAGPSVGSDQQQATSSTPPNNVTKATAKCTQLAAPQADFLTTQIASVAYGDLDKSGGGTSPIPPPLQGGTPLVDVQWTKDNAQVFINLFRSSALSEARTVQGGKGEERVSTLDGRAVVSLAKLTGVGHAWPAGSGDTSLAGGNWIHKVGFNYPAYVTEWFFANNRRLRASAIGAKEQMLESLQRIEQELQSLRRLIEAL